jgi:hypothetical protein
MRLTDKPAGSAALLGTPLSPEGPLA